MQVVFRCRAGFISVRLIGKAVLLPDRQSRCYTRNGRPVAGVPLSHWRNPREGDTSRLENPDTGLEHPAAVPRGMAQATAVCPPPAHSKTKASAVLTLKPISAASIALFASLVGYRHI